VLLTSFLTVFITNTMATCSRLFPHILTPLPTGPYNFPPRDLVQAAELLTNSVHTSHPWEDLPAAAIPATNEEAMSYKYQTAILT